MDAILNIIIIILILGVIIFVHELGHLIASKIFKVYVEEFAIGMGPKILGKKIGETLYTLRLFPIGGYNKIKGEEYEEEDKDPRSLRNQKAYVRIIIFLSGVFMNVLLAILIFYGLLISMDFNFPLSGKLTNFTPVFGTIVREKISDITYNGLVDGGVAKANNFPESGTIKSIDGNTFTYSDQAGNYIKDNPDTKLTFEICQPDNTCKNYEGVVSDTGKIGIVLYTNYYSNLEYQGWQKPFAGFLHLANWVKIFEVGMSDIFSNAAKTGNYNEVAMSVSGPVGLYVVVDYLRQGGWVPLIAIVADISLTVGIMNLLPLPALDGGRALLLFVEMLRGKPINPKVEAWAITISFGFLLLLMVAVLFKDIFFFKDLQQIFK